MGNLLLRSHVLSGTVLDIPLCVIADMHTYLSESFMSTVFCGVFPLVGACLQHSMQPTVELGDLTYAQKLSETCLMCGKWHQCILFDIFSEMQKMLGRTRVEANTRDELREIQMMHWKCAAIFLVREEKTLVKKRFDYQYA